MWLIRIYDMQLKHFIFYFCFSIFMLLSRWHLGLPWFRKCWRTTSSYCILGSKHLIMSKFVLWKLFWTQALTVLWFLIWIHTTRILLFETIRMLAKYITRLYGIHANEGLQQLLNHSNTFFCNSWSKTLLNYITI